MKNDLKNSKKQIRNLYVLSLVTVILIVSVVVLVTWYILLVTGAVTVDYLED